MKTLALCMVLTQKDLFVLLRIWDVGKPNMLVRNTADEIFLSLYKKIKKVCLMKRVFSLKSC
jgi:hypothetical protein